MKQHRFDPVSFLFGALFSIVALVYLLDVPDQIDFGRQWLVPAVLIVGGLAVLANTRRTFGAGPVADDPATPDDVSVDQP